MAGGEAVSEVLDAETIVRLVANEGALLRGSRKSEELPLDATKNPKGVLRTVLRDVGTYATGRLLRRHGLPISGLTPYDTAGFPIFKHNIDDPDDKGFLVFE